MESVSLNSPMPMPLQTVKREICWIYLCWIKKAAPAQAEAWTPVPVIVNSSRSEGTLQVSGALAGFGVPVTAMGAWGWPCHRPWLALKSPCCFLLQLNLATHKDIGSPLFCPGQFTYLGCRWHLCAWFKRTPPNPHLGNSASQVYLLLYRQRCAFSFSIKRVRCVCLEVDVRVRHKGHGKGLSTPVDALPLRQGPSHFLHLRAPSSSTS